MEFRLTYRGPLAANGTQKEKHGIRTYLHAQLAELWRQLPLLEWAKREEALCPQPNPDGAQVARQVGPCVFVPLVCRSLSLVAHLDILLLRPGPPGEIIGHGGDIDNRLKTLFDALRIPNADEARHLPAPQLDQTPSFCLLEDDALVTQLTVTTDRLLESPTDKHVALVIRVAVRGTATTYANMDLTG